jgi:hypothetical protein
MNGEHLSWGRSVAGGFIASLVATPALALPPDLPIAFGDDMRLYVLIGSGILLFAALVMRLMHNKDNVEVDAGVVDAPGGYGMRFFPSDRHIAIE